MLKALWNDENGFLISAELVIVATILVIGLIVGLAQIQNILIAEMNDIALAIGALCQEYSIPGYSVTKGPCIIRTGGSSFNDTVDACDTPASGISIVCSDNCEAI